MTGRLPEIRSTMRQIRHDAANEINTIAMGLELLAARDSGDAESGELIAMMRSSIERLGSQLDRFVETAASRLDDATT